MGFWNYDIRVDGQLICTMPFFRILNDITKRAAAHAFAADRKISPAGVTFHRSQPKRKK